MDPEDWIKYMTEKLVVYVETPREVRKQKRSDHKQAKEPWLTRWFGVPGMSMLIWFRGHRRKEG